MQEPWTIAELAELAAETLATTDSAEPPSGPARANGRVRDVPNERLVRWYATVGLVDPPLSRRGRVAAYGRRHLLQLVAVKRRQAEGRSLAEIQAELTGATDETLAAVARVPGIRLTPEAALAAPARFWTRQPTQLTPGTDRDELDTGRPAEGEYGTERRGQAGPEVDRSASDTDRSASDTDRSASDTDRSASDTDRSASDTDRSAPDTDLRDLPGQWFAAPRLTRPNARAVGGIVHGVRLAAGVTLLLEGADREPGPEDVGGIIDAARPLLEELARRWLLQMADGQATGASGELGDLAEEGGHDN
jgi:hypothetical protein